MKFISYGTAILYRFCDLVLVTVFGGIVLGALIVTHCGLGGGAYEGWRQYYTQYEQHKLAYDSVTFQYDRELNLYVDCKNFQCLIAGTTYLHIDRAILRFNLLGRDKKFRKLLSCYGRGVRVAPVRVHNESGAGNEALEPGEKKLRGFAALLDRYCGLFYKIYVADLALEAGNAPQKFVGALRLVRDADQNHVTTVLQETVPSGVMRPPVGVLHLIQRPGTQRLDFSLHAVCVGAMPYPWGKSALELPGQITGIGRMALSGFYAPRSGRYELTGDMMDVDLSTAVLGHAAQNIYVPHLTLTLTPGQARCHLPEVRASRLLFSCDINYEVPGPQASGKVNVAAYSQGLQVSEIPEVWPPGTLPGAAEWIRTHFHEGQIQDVHCRISLQKSVGDKTSWDLGDLKMRFKLTEGALSYLKGLPGSTRVSAEAQLDRDGLRFSQVHGESQGLTAENGTIAILWRDGPCMLLDLIVQGQVADVITYLASPAIGYQFRYVDQKNLSGRVRANYRMRLPLGAAATKQPPEIAVRGEGLELQVRDCLFPGTTLGLHNLSVRYDPADGLRLEGGASLQGHTGRLSFRNPPGKPSLAVIDTTVALSPKSREKSPLHAWVTPFCTGEVPVTVTLTTAATGASSCRIKADLTHARTNTLFFLKEAGNPARLEVSGAFDFGAPGRSETRPRTWALAYKEGASRVLKGDIQTRAGSITSGALALSLQGERVARVTMKTTAAKYTVAVSGRALPLEGLHEIAMMPASEVPVGEAAAELDLKVGAMRLLPERTLQDVHAHVLVSQGRVVQMGLKALLRRARDGARFVYLDLKTDHHGKRKALVRSNGAGELLRTLGITEGIRGGELYASFVDDPNFTQDTWEGRCQVDNFLLQKVPLSMKLFSIIFPTGLSSLSQGGMRFNCLKTVVGVKGPRINVHAYRMWNGSVGLALNGRVTTGSVSDVKLRGAMTPAYAVNQLLSRVPILGPLLIGGSEEGLFSTYFSIYGPLDSCSIEANPISTFTPGILKKFYGHDVTQNDFYKAWMEDERAANASFLSDFTLFLRP